MESKRSTRNRIDFVLLGREQFDYKPALFCEERRISVAAEDGIEETETRDKTSLFVISGPREALFIPKAAVLLDHPRDSGRLKCVSDCSPCFSFLILAARLPDFRHAVQGIGKVFRLVTRCSFDLSPGIARKFQEI